MSVAIQSPPRSRIASKRANLSGGRHRSPVDSKGSYVAILADGLRIPVSRDGHARLKALLGEENGKS